MTDGRFAPMPDPPYWAVIFTAERKDTDPAGYGAMADRMVELAAGRPGFVGVETARGADGFGITVSYWADEASLRDWKEAGEHLLAQKLGKDRWYSHYRLRVARVERAYAGPEGR